MPAPKKDATVTAVKHPLLEKPVPHAYALIQDPARPGRWYAVHLVNVSAQGIEHLEPSARSEMAPHGMIRIGKAMERRHVEKKWGV